MQKSIFYLFPKQALVVTCMQYKSFENTRKRRNCSFLLFPQCFLFFLRAFCHFHQIQNFRLQTRTVWRSLKFAVWVRVKQQIPTELRSLVIAVASEKLENIASKKEKMLHKSNFSFPAMFSNFQKLFFFQSLKALLCGTGLQVT